MRGVYSQHRELKRESTHAHNTSCRIKINSESVGTLLEEIPRTHRRRVGGREGDWALRVQACARLPPPPTLGAYVTRAAARAPCPTYLLRGSRVHFATTYSAVFAVLRRAPPLLLLTYGSDCRTIVRMGVYTRAVTASSMLTVRAISRCAGGTTDNDSRSRSAIALTFPMSIIIRSVGLSYDFACVYARVRVPRVP